MKSMDRQNFLARHIGSIEEAKKINLAIEKMMYEKRISSINEFIKKNIKDESIAKELSENIKIAERIGKDMIVSDNVLAE